MKGARGTNNLIVLEPIMDGDMLLCFLEKVLRIDAIALQTGLEVRQC